MQVSGLVICDSNGLHTEDDWCSPRVQLRVEANCHATELRVGIWLLADDDPIGTLVSVTYAGARPVTRALKFDQLSEIVVPVRLQPGDDFSFQVDCEHLIKNKGEDKRMLSFVMTSLTAV